MTYLFVYRAPAGYAPSGGSFDAWATWEVGLGARLKDHGNPARLCETLGAPAAATMLGGYSVVRAADLAGAVALARGCPILRQGGTVEVAELANIDDAFDKWLSDHPSV